MGSRVDFERAVIPVEKEREFGELRAAIERVFAPGSAEKFLRRLESRGLRVRDFEGVLEKRSIEDVDGALKQSGTTAKALYQGLTVSDQGQMREFYLSKIEQVEVATRCKFRTLYQYY
jgi:hypothetical protein